MLTVSGFCPFCYFFFVFYFFFLRVWYICNYIKNPPWYLDRLDLYIHWWRGPYSAVSSGHFTYTSIYMVTLAAVSRSKLPPCDSTWVHRMNITVSKVLFILFLLSVLRHGDPLKPDYHRSLQTKNSLILPFVHGLSVASSCTLSNTNHLEEIIIL